MSQDISPLFEPLQVKDKLLRNRIVMPPMVTCRNIAGPDGIEWYSERAEGGVSLVIVEATAVERFGDPGAELTADSLRPLVQAIHEGGALAAIQLFPVTFNFPRTDPLPTPGAVTGHDIERIIDRFGIAARVCAEAGFDGVEPHGAHDYLINQFFSPEQNIRTDEYGGSIENRMRFATEIVSAVRRDDLLVLYRHTPKGRGYGVPESLQLAKQLVDTGVDVLDISPASVDEPGDMAEHFMGLGVPVIAVNELDEVDRALTVLSAGRADLIAVGRGLIADPEWPAKVKEGRTEQIVRCERCNEGCFGNLRLGQPIECIEWTGMA